MIETTPIAVPALHSLLLAGGASSRMGMDKALLAYNGVPQVRRAAALLEKLGMPVFVSVRPGQADNPVFEGLQLLPDAEEGVGPLEGILAAFRRDPQSAWLVVAVDMPWLTERTLLRLCEARDPHAHATAFRNPETDRPEPVCAIYEPKILPVLNKAKETRRYSLMLLRDVPIRLIEPPQPEELRNVNEPSEYLRVLSLRGRDWRGGK